MRLALLAAGAVVLFALLGQPELRMLAVIGLAVALAVAARRE